MAKSPALTEQPRNRNSLIKSGNNPGSWTFRNHPEALLNLQDSTDLRLDALAGEGYVPAVAETRKTKRRQSAKDFWTRSAYLADYQKSGEEIHKMPDDWTKAKLAGNSSSGYRHTTLRTYKGAGVDLRMPSATAVKEYAKAIGNQVMDIPVELTDAEGKTLQGWVRAVKTGTGEWQTQMLGTNKENHVQAAMAAESVAAILEARRPTVALDQVDNLLRSRRERIARAGTKAAEGSIAGGTFKDLAYDTNTGTLSMNYVGRVIGRQVPLSVAKEFLRTSDPIDMWRKMIRGAQNAVVRECDSCRRRHASSAKHVCPVDMKAISKGKISEPRLRTLRNFRESGVVQTLAGKGKPRN